MPYKHYYFDKSTNENLDLNFKLLYTGMVKDEPGWFNISHSHDFAEILYVAGGQGEAYFNNCSHQIKEGDLIIWNPNIVHEEKSDPDKPLNLIFLAIDKFRLPGMPPNNILDEDDFPIIHSMKYKYKVESYLTDLLQETSGKVEFYHEMCNGLVTSILILVWRIYIAEDNSKNNDISDECRRVKEYIDNNYTSEINLETLSKNVYVSKYHLSHIFKTQTGTSPIKYLITKRINEASKLLTETDLSITEIAHLVGYDDPVYFSQIFKRTKNVSPLTYRNSIKSEK